MVDLEDFPVEAHPLLDPQPAHDLDHLHHSMTGLGLAIATFGMSSRPSVGIAALFVGGIMYMVSVSLSTTLVQINTAEDHRGRVMALCGAWPFSGSGPWP